MNKPRSFAACGLALFLALGCAPKQYNPVVTPESSILENPIQLTRGFDKAGEAYFSPDMSWIIFQAVPSGQQQYQMYVAPVKWSFVDTDRALGARFNTPLPGRLTTPVRDEIIGIGRPVRISPENSRNTCGYFSPDGNSLIFASTANKENPSEPTAGYQRQGRDYRWSYPEGMEIFRADGWQGAVAAAEPNAIVNLAQHPLTNNHGYDAECAYSPDGKWIVFSSDIRSEFAVLSDIGPALSPSTNRSTELDLYVMRPDGTNITRLTRAPGYDGGPFFSPDGRRIVYRSDRAGDDKLQVFVADLVFDRSGSITGITNEKQLTKDDNVNWGPYWHPDGKHIIYSTSMHGHENYELYLMRDDGSRKTRVTTTPKELTDSRRGADVLPVFSPDGRYLMWTAKRGPDGTAQIFVAKFKMPKGA